MKEENKKVNEIAKILVKKYKEQNKRILGLGHRIHTSDPRTKRLFELAKEYKIAAKHVALSKTNESELEIVHKKKLPLNIDGAIVAIIFDMGFNWRLEKAFFIVR